MMYLGIPLFLLAALLLIVAQVLLSRKKRRWFWGLLLPGLLEGLGLACFIAALAVDSPFAGYTAGQTWRTILAYLLLYSLPALSLLAVYGACRLARVWQKILVVAAILLLLPVRLTANDGGSVVYQAAAYRIVFLHEIHVGPDGQTDGFLEGTSVEIFPLNFRQTQTAFARARDGAVLKPVGSRG